MNTYNIRLAEQGRKRRAKLYREFKKANVKISIFALWHGMSRQRMQVLIARAITDSVRI